MAAGHEPSAFEPAGSCKRRSPRWLSHIRILLGKGGSCPMSAIAACLAESGPSAVLPFTTSMTADHAPRAFSAEMNECLKLGSGGGGANVRVWVELSLFNWPTGSCGFPVTSSSRECWHRAMLQWRVIAAIHRYALLPGDRFDPVSPRQICPDTPCDNGIDNSECVQQASEATLRKVRVHRKGRGQRKD